MSSSNDTTSTHIPPHSPMLHSERTLEIGEDVQMDVDNAHQEHPRHARKRPRHADAGDDTDTSRPSTPAPANASSLSSGTSSRLGTPTPPTLNAFMNATMREASDMVMEIQRLKKETGRLDQLLKDHLRVSSEQARRVERRVDGLERAAQKDEIKTKKAMDSQRASFPISDGVTKSVIDRVDLDIQDTTLRSKIALLLEEVYDLAQKDLLLSTCQSKNTKEPEPDPNPNPLHTTESISTPSTSITTTSYGGSGSRDTSPASTMIEPSSPVEMKHIPSPPPSRSPTSPSLSEARMFTPNPQPGPVKTDYVCLHPPFTPEISYETLSHNPEWFLDPVDFTPSGGLVYPDALVPPKESDERVRCTFCRRKWDGEGSRKYWREHVETVHGVVVGSKPKPKPRPEPEPATKPKDKDDASKKPVVRNPKKADHEPMSYRPQKTKFKPILPAVAGPSGSGSGSGPSSSRFDPSAFASMPSSSQHYQFSRSLHS